MWFSADKKNMYFTGNNSRVLTSLKISCYFPCTAYVHVHFEGGFFPDVCFCENVSSIKNHIPDVISFLT